MTSTLKPATMATTLEQDNRLNATILALRHGVIRHDLSEGMSGYETCDDGNLVNEDACLSNCLVARCGERRRRARSRRSR